MIGLLASENPSGAGQALIELLLTLSILSNFVQLGTSRLAVSVRAIGAQGIFLGALPLILPSHGSAIGTVFLAVASVGLKGLVFPRCCFGPCGGLPCVMRWSRSSATRCR